MKTFSSLFTSSWLRSPFDYQRNPMKRQSTSSLVVGLLLAAGSGSLLAQTPAPAASAATRAEVKMETAEFKKTHVYDPVTETWMVKPGVDAPAGMKSRARIKAERDEFLRNNRWEESSATWIPLKGKPRDMSTLTRAQVKAETAAFLKTHYFDEVSEVWTPKIK
jgi:hypothetical protein